MSLTRFKLLFKGMFAVYILVMLVMLIQTAFSPQRHAVQKSPPLAKAQMTTVLGIATIPTPTLVPLVSGVVQQPTGALPPVTHLAETKSSYVIAVYGDGMEDSMGNRLERIASLLSQLHPSFHFNFYNYGVSGQSIQEGLARFDSVLPYKARNYPSITEIKPDAIIVGSFAYTPSTPADAGRHKALLTQLVQRAKGTGAKVYLLAEVAPLGSDFGQGPYGKADWTLDYRLSYAREIIDQMQNVFSVARETLTPVIDLYDKTKSNGPFGSWAYTSRDDGMQPSPKGQDITADAIVHSIF